VLSEGSGEPCAEAGARGGGSQGLAGQERLRFPVLETVTEMDDSSADEAEQGPWGGQERQERQGQEGQGQDTGTFPFPGAASAVPHSLGSCAPVGPRDSHWAEDGREGPSEGQGAAGAAGE